MWPFKKVESPLVDVADSKEVLVAKAIADEFLSGEITSSDLDPFGISELKVCIDSMTIGISWYSNRASFRNITIQGGSFITSTESAKIILDAALKRSNLMLDEKLDTIGSRILSSRLADKGE